MNTPWLTLLTAAPLLGGLLVAWLPRSWAGRARPLCLAWQGAVAVLALWIAGGFDGATGQLQFVERRSWVPALGAEYFLGLDGLGLVSVLLTALVPWWSTWVSERVAAGRERLYHALVLFLQAGLFGTFTALNFFHWFLFWELGLVPAYLLVRFFGGAGAGAASFRFFVYTMVGSVALLLGFLALRAVGGSFDFVQLTEFGQSGRLASALGEKLPWAGVFASGEALAVAVFLGVLLGFAVKMPLWPFHTWLPETYAAAPSPVTMMLTGVMSKMGVYGMLRIALPIFPDQFRACQGVLVALALATVVLPTLSAFAQTDVKRVLAYSSINHLGYCALALFVLAPGATGAAWVEGVGVPALNGVMLQMLNHGITAAALFAAIEMLERRGAAVRTLGQVGGLRRVAPVLCGLMGISVFSSIGLPGLNGFVGEFLIFRGVFAAQPWVAALASVGLLTTAIFLLTLMQKVFHGPPELPEGGFADLGTRERWQLAVPVAVMLVLGVYPDLILRLTNGTALKLAGGH